MSKQDTTQIRGTMYRYPHLIGLISVGVLAGILQIFAILDCVFPLITYEVDPVSSVMSTFSEVLAGLYGITLTGYIFFADRFRDTSKEDESLYDAVQALLIRYNHMAGFISLLCLFCIILAEGVVLYGSNTLLPSWLYRFWINETLLLCLCTFDLILYFVISVLDPHKIQRISSQKKAKISEDPATGDPESFLEDWGRIKELLLARYDELNHKILHNRGANQKPQFVRMLEILRNYNRISWNLWRKLDKLRQYHNLSLHDVNTAVSQEMCDLAEEVLAELEKRK